MTVDVEKTRRRGLSLSDQRTKALVEEEPDHLEGSQSDTSTSFASDDGDGSDKMLSRSIRAGQKIRRSTGTKQSEASRETKKNKKPTETKERNSDVKVNKTEPQGKGGLKAKQDKYSSKTDEEPAGNDDGSLDSEPPIEKDQKTSRGFDGNSSFNSVSRRSGSRSLASYGGSLDLSSHGILPVHDPIITSATGEQWARFKLLGRTGLGDIVLSAEAKILVERNFEIMLKAIKNIYALRDDGNDDSSVESVDAERVLDIRTGRLLEEVQKTIHVSEEGPARLKRDPKTIEVKQEIQDQLRDYITVISSMYRDNPFHDFEHASTVLRAVDKLINLVSPPDDNIDYTDLKYGCGVATEPWNHFALVFSALVHDVDHAGVPNAQLIKEHSRIADAYKNRSVAEQNSIELAWNLLMEPCYKELRESVFLFRSEMTNFRNLVVTAVMATDIADKELKALRTGRAAEALKAEEDEAETNMDLVSRKATFVVETLIQVADVSHTMGSFDMYKQWNHRLYKEMYAAYCSGRADTDPTDTWYKGEFGFFDFYIIPLAKKLNDCGISAEASSEYVNNAIRNRKIWEKRGETLLAHFVTEREEEEKIRKKTLSLHEMAIESSSSDESDYDDGFAFDSDNDDMDLDAGRPSRSSFVPSKAKVEEDNVKMRGRRAARSMSPELTTERPRSNRKVVRSGGASASQNSNSASEGSSQGKLVNTRSRSHSPNRQTISKIKKGKMRGRRPARSVSPVLEVDNLNSAAESPRNDSHSKADAVTSSRSPVDGSSKGKSKKVRSRSHSPKRETTTKGKKGKLRGRRPARSMSPVLDIHDEDIIDKETTKGKARKTKKHDKKKKDRSVSPGSKEDIKSDRRGRSSLRSLSSVESGPGEKLKDPKKKKKVRKGRRPSRSASPALDSIDEPDVTATKSKKKKGKRNTKSKANATQISTGSNDAKKPEIGGGKALKAKSKPAKVSI